MATGARDTHAAAAEAQVRALRALPPARRLDLALEMSLAARELLAARLQAEHPSWSPAECAREVLLLSLPPELRAAVSPK